MTGRTKCRLALLFVLVSAPVAAGRAFADEPPAPPPPTPAPGSTATGAGQPPPATSPPPTTTTTSPMPPPPPPVVATTTASFGAAGQFVLATDAPLAGAALNIIHSSRSMNMGSGNSTQIQPVFDYFLAPSFSLGVTLAYNRASDSQSVGAVNASFTLTTIAITPHLGYSIPIADSASIWIRAALGYRHQEQSFTGTTSQTGYAISYGAEAMLIWHPVSHFFLGAGPAVGTDAVSKVTAGGMSADAPKTTNFGLVSILGGYFGGT